MAVDGCVHESSGLEGQVTAPSVTMCGKLVASSTLTLSSLILRYWSTEWSVPRTAISDTRAGAISQKQAMCCTREVPPLLR